VLAQSLGLAAAVGAGQAGLLHDGGPWAFVFIAGSVAALAAGLLRSAPWWLPIHFLFPPLLLLASRWQISPLWYLAGFILLLLFYWSSFRTQVPLYLSNRRTAEALAELIPPEETWRVLDLGSGTGSVVRRLARMRPAAHCVGIESAPAPLWISRLLGRGQSNLELLHGDFFAHPWQGCRLVYAFLSPVPMADVWAKAALDMPPGGLLVSNSFPVPGVPPQRSIEVGDRRGTVLHVYRVPGPGKPARTKPRGGKRRLAARGK
jgi:hypothetical protein